MGRGSVVGQTMLDSKDVNAISFTGSVETGAKVAMACAGAAQSSSLRWAARIRSSCWTMPASMLPLPLRSMARFTRPASAARHLHA